MTDAALIYFRILRHLRDLVAAGRREGEAEWEQVVKLVKSTLDTTQDVMRTDLQRV